MKLAASASDRVRVQELGPSTDGNPFISVLVGDADTIKNLERYRQLARRLYFRNGTPNAREREEIFRQGKAVVLVTAGVHSTEVGPTQATLELVHRLATDESPATKRILENVLLIVVPSINPDGHVMVTDWFYRNQGTPFEASPLPHLYHKYAGHDLNRDMYMLTQKESQYVARLVWQDWLPVVWLDQHQMNSNGARMFVMPAADPINPNVHPLIYRWNGILGQSQAAALEAAGKEGIIYNSTYTNFWQGPLAWSGWWHNQIGLLTEIASARVASPLEQLRASVGQPGPPAGRGGGAPRFDSAPLLPPSDIVSRTEYPRPWMGGRWSLRDIVDYSLISTVALLEAVGRPTRDDSAEHFRDQQADGRRAPARRPNRPRDRARRTARREGSRPSHRAPQARRRRRLPCRGPVRVGAAALCRRDVCHPDVAGLRQIREGPPRAANLSRSTARAERAG